LKEKKGDRGSSSVSPSSQAQSRPHQEKKKKGVEPLSSSPSSAPSARGGFLSFDSFRSLLSFRPSTAPANQSRVAVTVAVVAPDGGNKTFDPPPLSRLPSHILKEQRKQELIDRKSRRKFSKAGWVSPLCIAASCLTPALSRSQSSSFSSPSGSLSHLRSDHPHPSSTSLSLTSSSSSISPSLSVSVSPSVCPVLKRQRSRICSRLTSPTER
jgi:hypothetical protein